MTGKAAWTDAMQVFMNEVAHQRKTGEITKEDEKVYARGAGAFAGFMSGLGYLITKP